MIQYKGFEDMNSEQKLEHLGKSVNENYQYLKFIGGAIFCGTIPLAFGESVEIAARWAVAGGVIVTLFGKSSYYWEMKSRRMREKRVSKNHKPKNEQKE